LLVNFARWKQVEIRLSKSRLFYEELLGMMVKFGKTFSILKMMKIVNAKKSTNSSTYSSYSFDSFRGDSFFSLLLLFFIEVEILAYAKKFVYNKTID
jgi:hypothetical protein